MITLEAADLIEGDASAANVVDYTINGAQIDTSNDIAIKALADGQLAAAKGTLYTTPASTEAVIKSITLVNTDASARTVNLYVQRDGTNSRRIIPESLSLEANGGSVVLSSDGLQVFTAAGALLSSTTSAGHAILDSSVHTDSAADTVTRGSVIYGNATPAWDEFGLGAVDTFVGSDGTDLSNRTAAQVWASLSGEAAADVNMPNNIAIQFGDAAEEISGDGTDLTIAGNNINLTAVADVVVPANVGVTFGTGEKIEGNNTDLTVTSGADINLTAVGDVNIPASVGVTFGDDGEKIEGDGTDLTIASSNLLNLTATTDIIIPVNVGLKLGDGGEHIETDNTDLTITSGGELNLTAASDVVIPVNIGLHLGDGAEKLESNNTNLTINSGGDIDLTATSNVNIPSGVGVTFGDDGEIISGDGTDLTIASSGVLNITGTTVAFNDKVLSAVKGLLLTAATELTLDTNGAITVTQMVHTVDTFENAASDNLVTINGGTTVGVLFLRPAHTDRSIVVDTGAGNVILQGGSDITLDDITDHMMLFWDTTNSKWVDFGGGGGGANTALSNLASVAINTTLVSDGDNTDDLGTDAVRWKDLYLSGKIECLGGIWDDDADTGIQVEESADEDIIRMDVGGAGGDNVFLMSAAGILTLAKQPLARAFLKVAGQTIPSGEWVHIALEDELFDIQSEFDVSRVTGTADATGANKLHDDDGGFQASDVGKTVWNTTDNTYTTVSGFVDNGELDLTDDIMVDTEGYHLYFARYTATEAGYYQIDFALNIATPVDQQWVLAGIYKNGTKYNNFVMTASGVKNLLGHGADLIYLAATDYIDLRGYQDAGVPKVAAGNDAGTSTALSIVKVA